MRIIYTTLLVTSLIVGCGDNPEIKQSTTLVSKRPANTLSADTTYIQPTELGENPNKQAARLTALLAIDKPSTMHQRLIALTQLALFSSDGKQTLAKLSTITDALKALSNDMPNDYELMAAYGSALSYQSVFMQDNLGKMNLTARKGMRIMDRAVKQAPNNLGARLLRGVSYANMPSFLNRAQFAIADLALVKQHTNALPPSHFIDFIDYYLALALSRNDQLPQAKALWSTLSERGGAPFKAQAITRLKENS